MGNTKLLIICLSGLGFDSEVFKKIEPELLASCELKYINYRCNYDNNIYESSGFGIYFKEIDEITNNNSHRNVVILGWSAGATIALSYLSHHKKSNLKGLIAIEQPPYILNENDWSFSVFGGLRFGDVNSMLHAIITEYDSFCKELIGRLPAYDNFFTQNDIDLLFWNMRENDPKMVMNIFSDIVSTDLRKDIIHISIPICYIHGGKSCVYPNDPSEWYLKNCQKPIILKFKDSGHMPFWDAHMDFVSSIYNVIENKMI